LACVGCLTAGLLACGALSGPAQGQEKKDKTNKEKIIGNWELVKTDEPLPPGIKIIVNFGKDGKMKVTATFMGMTRDQEGMYEVKGDKLETTQKQGDKEKKETDTIQTLDDKQLITINAKKQKTEFKRVK
jgi:uncharacterized protein (TIGR03066 family)